MLASEMGLGTMCLSVLQHGCWYWSKHGCVRDHVAAGEDEAGVAGKWVNKERAGA